MGKTNTDLPDDLTLQPHYMGLPAKQQELVDRAIYGQVIQGDKGHYDFSQAMRDKFKGPPNSQQIEQEIERLRETYATGLEAEAPGLEAQLAAAARHAPKTPGEARRALNAVIAFHGDDCGCARPVAIDANPILSTLPAPAHGRAGRTY